MKKGMLLMLAGSSGSGKNTIINYLAGIRDDVEFLVSHTTREMRPHEKNGVTYHFVSKQEFEKAIANEEMLEHDITHRGYYGISKKTIQKAIEGNKVVVKDMSVLGILNSKKELGNSIPIYSIFLTEKKNVLKQRLIKRGEKNYKLRLKIYKKEQSQKGNCDYIIRNRLLQKSVEIVECIIEHAQQQYEFENVSGKKVKKYKIDKYEKQINTGKKMSPICVKLVNGKIAVVKNYEKYLASLKCKRIVSKKFVDCIK